MNKPTCEKCGSTFLRLVEDYTGYYSHCKCGTIKLLHSKLEEAVKCSLSSYEDDEEDEKPKARKCQTSHNGFLLYLARLVGELTKDKPCVSSGQIKDILKDHPIYGKKNSDVITTNLTVLHHHKIIERVENRKGLMGGSTWRTSTGYDDYVNEEDGDFKGDVFNEVIEYLLGSEGYTSDIRASINEGLNINLSSSEVYRLLVVMERQDYVKNLGVDPIENRTIWRIGSNYKEFYIKNPTKQNKKCLEDSVAFSFSKVEQGESVVYAHNFEQKSKGTMLSFVQQMYA